LISSIKQSEILPYLAGDVRLALWHGRSAGESTHKVRVRHFESHACPFYKKAT
jgi:hypothetical protein